MNVREGPIEWPEMERFSDTPMFNTKAVVQQTGVPAPTLRAWERRYKLLSPERAHNDYRLYSERDIITIRWLKERVDSGMAISQAIALFQHLRKEPHQARGSENEARSEPALRIDSPFVFQVATSLQTSEVASAPQEHIDELHVQDWPQLDSEFPQEHAPLTHNMNFVRERLIEVFDSLDETMANMLMGSMLAIYPVEQVCLELIVPTMWQIGQRWVDGHSSVPVEHFATNFFRGLLINLLHVAARANAGPLVMICCGPGEAHELAPLMVALFLRRRGMRVVYFGQSIEITGLMQMIKRLKPALICVSLTMPNYLSSLIDLAREIEALPPPRPMFAFGGQAFAQYATIIPQIPGIYLDGDLKVATTQLYTMAQVYADHKN